MQWSLLQDQSNCMVPMGINCFGCILQYGHQYCFPFMPETKYLDIRKVPDQANPFLEFRPSGITRILKGTFECTVFATLATYGFVFNGYGIHSYYLEKIGLLASQGPWKRTLTFGSLFFKFLALSLPFYYSKEVLFGAVDQWTRNQSPQIRNHYSKAWVNNMLATLVCFPLSFALYRAKLMPAVRASLLLCVFSNANDLAIEFSRRGFFRQNYTPKEMREIEMKGRMDTLKSDLQESMKDGKATAEDKKKIEKIDLQGVEKWLSSNQLKTTQEEIEELRMSELQSLSALFNEETKWLKNLFE